MRAVAAIVIVAACSIRGQADSSRDTVSRHLLTLLGVSPRGAIHNALQCSQSIGPSKCLATFSIWRAKKALGSYETQNPIESKLVDDVRQFPWKQYSNTSQEEVEKQLCDGTEKLLQRRALKLKVSGYDLELMSNGNGTINIDVLRGQLTDSSRGMKKNFYNIVPYLLLPGLIMSAVLPFILPALKLMTVGVGMLNNMALSGAVFTLLRNNAFNDKYHKKVIYINEGYRNEEIPYHSQNSQFSDNVYEFQYDDKHNFDVLEAFPSKHANTFVQEVNGADFDVVEELPATSSNKDWVKKYHGFNSNNKYIAFLNQKSSSKRKSNKGS